MHALTLFHRAGLAQRRGIHPLDKLRLTREQAERVYRLVDAIDEEILRHEREVMEKSKRR